MKDLLYAFRSLRNNPGFTLIAVLSLGLGIGANTAIFSLMDRVLLRLLPVRDPGQLVLLKATDPRLGMVSASYNSDYVFSAPMYRDFRDRAPVFDGVIAWFPITASLTAGGQTELIQVHLVSGNYFDVLGARTVRGRTIEPDDDRAAAGSAVVVLSHGFWTRRFGADPAVLNRTLDIGGHPMTVVGIAAAGFNGVSVGEAPAIFAPLASAPQLGPLWSDGAIFEQRRSSWLNLMARLKPGVTRPSAEAAMNVFWKPILEDEAKEMTQVRASVLERFRNRHISLVEAGNGISTLRTQFSTPLLLLMGLVGLVLLIACANVANLLLARAASRQREIAIRLALGAGRGDIIRQVFAESALLCFAGGALGVMLAAWTGGLLLKLVPIDGIGEAISTEPDARILLFAAGVSILCGLLFGLAPALQSARGEVAGALKDQAANVSSSAGQVRSRRALVVAQITLSLLLLIGAGLFLRSLQNLRSIDPGFRADHLMSFSLDPTLNGYTQPRAVTLYDNIAERVRSLPGVSSVASSQTALLTGTNWMSSIVIPNRERKETDKTPNVDSISAGYFANLGTPLVAGREFTRMDGTAAPKVAVVNQAFAEMYFESQNPVGRQFYFSGDKDKALVEIVGVVKDGKYADLREEKQLFVFCPYAQHYGPGAMTFYVRTSRDPEAAMPGLRQAVRESDAGVPLFDIKTVERQIDESIFVERIISELSVCFGALATLLAAIGLYGVLAYMVTRRTREIGLRMALGATRGQVLAIVLKEVAWLAGIGIAIAIPVSIPLARVAQSMLFGVRANDVPVMIGASLLLAAVAMVAGYIPAARATRVDPLSALRHD
jgi:predicted permease